MASQLRVNKSENRSGLGTITYTDTGAIVSGIVTANSFSGDIIGNITGAVTGTTGSFSGDVSIAEKIIHTGDTNTFMKFDTDTVTFETAGDERLRITSAGKVIAGGASSADSSALISIIKDTTEVLADNEPLYNNASPAFLTVYNSNNTGSGEEAGINIVPAGNANGAISIYGKKTGSYAGDLIFRFRSGASTSAERLRITSAGKVGINEDVPQSTLHVASTSNYVDIGLSNSTSGHTGSDGANIFLNNNLELALWNRESTGVIRFATAGTERLRIDSAGRMGLGVSPTASHSNVTASIFLKDGNTLLSRTGGQFLGLLQNIKYTAADAVRYLSTGFGSAYHQDTGVHKFFTTAASGTGNTSATLLERLRITTHGGTAIFKSGTIHADSGYAGLEVRASSSEHQLVLSSSSTASNSNYSRLGFKLHPSYQNERIKAAIVCQGSGGGYGEVDRMMFCIDSAADNGSAAGNSIDEKLRITSDGLVKWAGHTLSARNSATGVAGGMIYNTDAKVFQYYDGSGWQTITSNGQIVATGGNTVTTSGGYRIHDFVGSSTFEITSGVGEVEILVVGGGGSEGGDTSGCHAGGGGGGGGVVYQKRILYPGKYAVTIGAGGLWRNNGANSKFGNNWSHSTIYAYGGGAGGPTLTGNGNNGGSGGGGSRHTTTNQGGSATQPVGPDGGFGNAGGDTGDNTATGGGGGAGGAGQDGDASNAGRGGAGKQFTQFGVTTYFGAGGNAQGSHTSEGQTPTSTNGAANTGAGGGGRPGGSTRSSGGSGRVMVRYLAAS